MANLKVDFDLDAPAIQVSRSAAAPLVKTFNVWDRGALLVCHRYWWADFHNWVMQHVN